MIVWKRLFTAAICVCLAVCLLPATVFAEDSGKKVVHYSDGSYSITEITYDGMQYDISLAATQNTRKGTKTERHYNASDDLEWTFTLYGEFTYDGRTSKAIDADYSYQICDSSWSFVSGSASYSGAKATATGKFRHTLTTSTTVSLTCSANGTLS